MATNLALNDKLIREAKRLGRHKTKKAAVNEALRRYVNHQKQLKIFDFVGKIDYDPDYDYKKERRRE